MKHINHDLTIQERRNNESIRISRDELVSMPAQEVFEKRTDSSKVFSLGENRFQAVLFPEPVHYLDPDTGKYEPIDNRLDDISQEKGKRVLRNRKNPHLRISMAAADQNESIVIEDDAGHRISWAFSGAKAVFPVALRDEKAMDTAKLNRVEEALSNSQSAAQYSGIFPGADLKCSIQGHMFKDELVFSSRDAVNTVHLTLHAPSLTAAKGEQGNILIADGKGETVFTLPTPFMKSVQDEASFGSVAVNLVQSTQPDSWQITYTPDKEWLAGAQYPVILDPAVITRKHSSAIEDNYITSSQPNTVQPYAGAAMKITYNSGSWGTSKSFIRFLNEQLPAIDSSYYVTKAYMFVQTRSAPTSPASVYLKEALGPWSSNTITYNNAPALNAFSLDYNYMDAASTWYSYDISNLVRKWYAGTNYGFALEANTGTFMELSTSDDSYNKPYVMISYVSLAGLESYLAYESQSVGLAGTGHVSLYNGNLIFEHQDTVCNGNILPVSVSHFYNSCYRNDDAFGVGKGWKTNYHQCLHRETLPDGTGDVMYYVYTDIDGTRHYFKQTGGVWKDQSGLELTLTISGSLVTIRDKGDNTMTFDLPTVEFNGNYANVRMIKTFADAHGNSVTVSTDSNRLLTDVVDGAGRYTGFSNYPRLSTIYPPGYGESGYCGFEYNTLGQMTKIWQLDGEPGARECTYTYNAQGLLETVTNHDGLKITYEYYLTREPYRVKKMSASNGSTPGNSRLYEYGDNLTVVTDLTVPNGKKLFYHFNDYGNVVSVNDQLGYAAFTKYNSSQPMNHPEVVSRMQRVVCSLLRNHGFENSDSWSLSSAMSYATDAKYMGNRSLKVTTQGVTGMHIASQSVLIERGKTYTFSFYARKSGDIDVWAYFAYTNASGQVQYVHAPSMKPQLTETFSRMSYTFTVPSDAQNSNISVAICAGGDNGVYAMAWFDCAQLEEGVVANRYNILENGDFSFNSGAQPISWQKNSTNTAQDIVYTTFDGVKPSGLSANTMRIYGEGRTKYAGIYQDMPLSGAAGDVFVAGGWSMNHSMPIEGEPYRYGIRVAFLQAGTSTRVNTPAVEWSEEWSDWQFAAGPVIAPVNYSAVRFNVDYERNINYTEFDGFFFNKEEFGTSFAYDSKGNILSSQDLAGLKDHAVYDVFNNMTSYRQPGKPATVQTVMEYGTTDAQKKKHLLLKATSPLGTIDEFTYAPKGVQTKAVKKSASAAAFMESSTLYTLNYNYPVTGKDARNKATETAYDNSLGILLYVDDPMGSRVNYLYDQIRRATKVYTESDGKTYMNEYAYTGDYLTGVKHNTGSNTVSDVIYYFSYDPLGNPTTVKVGMQTLSTNVYTSSGDKLLQRVDYGNGGKVHYSRDAFKRVTGIRFDSETADRYQYDFDAAGQVARVKDNALNRINLYEYDVANRPARTTQLDSNGWNMHTAVLSYDAYNNISRFDEQLGYWRTKYPTDFIYDNENRPTSLRYNGTVNRTDYVYDALGRISSRNAVLNNASYLSSYGYESGGYGANSTSPLVSSITQNGHNLSYAYDDNGNITSAVYKGQTIGYVYDALGQLVRVNDQVNNESWTYDYDRGGNILGKKRYSYTTGTLGSPNQTEGYLYGDANWKDKLTARVINGVSYPVVSDAIGNITSYAGWTYAWQAGRQLASQTNSGGTVEYKYNADGLRVQKKRGSTVTDYVLSGNNIAHMTVTGGHTLHFYYDGQNRPAQVQYNGTMYRYVHNLQGDIVAILDSAGNTVVQYAYDAWGGKKTTTGSMAGTLGYYNPFRYRGYVWDEETWMYYLRSRYYYPELQRFISADVEHKGNLFCYATNSPTRYNDSDGRKPQDALYEYLKWTSRPYKGFTDANNIYTTSYPGYSLRVPVEAWGDYDLIESTYETTQFQCGASQRIAYHTYDFLSTMIDQIADVVDANPYTIGYGESVRFAGNLAFTILGPAEQVDIHDYTTHRVVSIYVNRINRKKLQFIQEFNTSSSVTCIHNKGVLAKVYEETSNGKPYFTLFKEIFHYWNNTSQ